MAHNQELGRAGEEAACAYLSARGMAVVDRNWRCRYGEVDIVASDGPNLVFVEVKTRSSSRYGGPAEAVSAAKARRMRLVAGAWLAAHEHRPAAVRLDVLAVLGNGGQLRLVHYRGAV